jgi:hypothetical protein
MSIIARASPLCGGIEYTRTKRFTLAERTLQSVAPLAGEVIAGRRSQRGPIHDRMLAMLDKADIRR